jgi:hypothetical protein
MDADGAWMPLRRRAWRMHVGGIKVDRECEVVSLDLVCDAAVILFDALLCCRGASNRAKAPPSGLFSVRCWWSRTTPLAKAKSLRLLPMRYLSDLQHQSRLV